MADIFVIDADSLISAWYQNYPYANFPQLWQKFEQLVTQKRLIILQPVADEIKDASNALKGWVQSQKSHIVAVSQVLQDKQEEILKPLVAQPHLIATFKGADPYLVAYGELHACTVITQEREEEGRVKIPSACRQRKILCKPILHIIQTENWVF